MIQIRIGVLLIAVLFGVRVIPDVAARVFLEGPLKLDFCRSTKRSEVQTLQA